MNEKSRNNIYCYFIISIITVFNVLWIDVVNVKAATGFTQNVMVNMKSGIVTDLMILKIKSSLMEKTLIIKLSY